MEKPSRTVKQLQAMVQVRMNALASAVLAIDACVHDGFVAFKELDFEICESTYFLALLHYSKAVHEKSKAGAIFINVTTTDIKAMAIPLPPLALQHEFSRRLSELNRFNAVQRASLQHLEAIFVSIHYSAFSGTL